MGPKKATNAKSSATKAPTKPVNKGSSVRTSIASKKDLGTSKKGASSSSPATTSSKTSPKKSSSKSKEVVPAVEVPKEDVSPSPKIECKLAEIADVLIEDPERKIKDCGKWPILIDPSGNGVTFLKYRYTNHLCTLNENDMSPERLRPSLIGAIRYGKPFILDMMDVDHMEHIEAKLNAIQGNLFHEIMTKEIMKNERYLSLVRPSDDEDEYDKEKFTDMFLENFTFLITSKIAEVPQHWFQKFCVVKIV